MLHNQDLKMKDWKKYANECNENQMLIKANEIDALCAPNTIHI